MIFAPILRELIAAGLTGDALIAAIERIEAAQPEPDTRTPGAKRQARYRERNEKRHETSQGVTRDAPPPQGSETKVSPEPSSKTQPPIPSPTPPKGPPPLEGSFATFWAIYPAKLAKRTAELAWPAAVKRAGGAAVIVAGVEVAKRRSRKWREGFIPHPATWLRADGWLDDHGSPDLTVVASAAGPPPTPEMLSRRAEHYADTGEWKDHWGPFPQTAGAR